MNSFLRNIVLAVLCFKVVLGANNSLINNTSSIIDNTSSVIDFNDITSIVIEPTTKSSFDVEVNVLLDVSENCSLALDSFMAQATNLTQCIILNARPIHLCVKCEAHFTATMDSYVNLREEPTPCRTYYFESDQIGIIKQIYSQGRDFWSNNHCQNCQDFNNETIEFFDTAEKFENCIKKYNGTTEKATNRTCDMCQELFVRINEIYKAFVKRIGKDASEGVCMDIVDRMNITRHMWSNQNCLDFDTYVGYPNIITAVLVGAMPIFFYMLAKNISIIEDVKLVRPKRKSFASLSAEYPPSE